MCHAAAKRLPHCKGMYDQALVISESTITVLSNTNQQATAAHYICTVHSYADPARINNLLVVEYFIFMAWVHYATMPTTSCDRGLTLKEREFVC